MKISECMTRDVETVKPDQAIQEAAQFMLRSDAGAMPVCDGDRLVGMVTDRDIAVRAVAEGRGPDTPVREAMTDHIDYCYEDDEIETVAMRMSDLQVRRLRAGAVRSGPEVRERHRLAELLLAARGIHRHHRGPYPFHDPHRGSLQPVRRSSRARLS